ncbi:hypothetical protein E2F50_22630 [Rhizobium deserti]|uniref:GAD-related domain-containing protein n=1 Tax=Rhizobium deserti TaxID=2547961 RepID=A0A4R5U5T9_9HYPH|nr:hypothetical protein E2F50_22630 [Rhizobium deserti]
MSLRPYLELVEQHSAPNGGPVPLHEINSYRGRLPEGLLEFWAKYGRGIWPGGRSQLCDPATFAPLLEELFEGDPEFHAEDLLVYAMGAFGNLHLTDGSMRAILIDVNYRFFTV